MYYGVQCVKRGGVKMSRGYARFTEKETEDLRREVNSFIAMGRTEADAFRSLAEQGTRKENAYRDKWNSLKRKAKYQEHKPFVLEAVKELIDENVELKKQIEKLEKQVTETQPMMDEYQSLLEIMNRARKMAFVPDEPKPKFRMSQNGDLERIDNNGNGNYPHED
jgi:predicted RNase H-like nuclease (RuvC/YqgF family)